MAVGFSLFVGLVIYRNLTWKDLYRIFLQKRRDHRCHYFAAVISHRTGLVPGHGTDSGKVAAIFMSVSDNKYVILLLCNLFLIVVGMFLDIGPALLILAPILAPWPSIWGFIRCISVS